MSQRVDQLIQELTEYLETAQETAEADVETLRTATERIALLIGDNGLKPGDAIRLRNGTVYHVEPAYFRDDPEADDFNTGQLLCRNWRSLEPTDTVISDAEAHARISGVPLPNVWDEEPRERATVEDRVAFLKELPELARRLKTLATQRRDPEVSRAAKLAAKVAEVIEAEVAGPEL